jgi:predicted AAA+ superfamily ATPase
MIERRMKAKLEELARKFPVVAILGPRQSGKTTLAKETFPNHTFISLEDYDLRKSAEEDPRRFLSIYEKGEGLVIDEAQHVPELFSYLQTEVDRNATPGRFVLTGSQNFLLNQHISQTLAGRVAFVTLLPLSIGELQESGHLSSSIDGTMFKGGYPRIHAYDIPPSDWYPNYIRTYLERDIRDLAHVRDLGQFQRFVKLCAGRTGQLLNLTDLARDAAISPNTARAWIGMLEASYVIFLLQPHHNNFSKRLVKSPKIYFFDIGLVCSLLEVDDVSQVGTHYLRGALFESFVISELIKCRFNEGRRKNCFFWRDTSGHEVDCLIEKGGELYPCEIKSGATVRDDFFSGLKFWCRVAGKPEDSGMVIYGGDHPHQRKQGRVLSWRQLEEFYAN